MIYTTFFARTDYSVLFFGVYSYFLSIALWMVQWCFVSVVYLFVYLLVCWLFDRVLCLWIFSCLFLIPFCWFGSLHFIVIIWLLFKLKHIHKFLFLSYIFTSFPADYCLSCCLFFKRKKNRLELKVVGSCVAITGYSMQILERMNSMSQHQH